MSVRRSLLTACLALLVSLAFAAAAGAFSGQVFFGGTSVEPAINLADGSTLYLLTPDKAPNPSHANTAHATAPLYLVFYPNSSSVPVGSFNCSPTNCDHLPVVPQGIVNGFSSSSVYPTGTVNSPFLGNQTGGLYKGHDHLVGKNPTGDFNVAWEVWLVVFTPTGVANLPASTRITTLDQLNSYLGSGYVKKVDAGFAFNCSIVPENVYTQHMG